MARWSDIATWRGPTSNQGPGGMVEHRGVVLHIAVGWYEGTIAWQRNPASDVSSHFVAGRQRGELAQMVDTGVRAWTQGDGNGRWLSVENEGFLASDRRNPGGWEKLSDAQIEANAQILAKAHQVYGVPLAIADHPGEEGLGHHSMDREWLDEQWGHDQCPGAAIVAQKPLIVARAKEIVGGDQVDTADVDKVWNTDNIVAAPEGYDAEKNSHWTPANILRSAHLYSRLGFERARSAVAGQEALLAAVAGQDVADAAAAAARQAVRAEFATLGPALAEQLADVPAERVEAALRAVLGSLDEG